MHVLHVTASYRTMVEKDPTRTQRARHDEERERRLARQQDRARHVAESVEERERRLAP